jgi:hypothetical protein
MYREDVMAYAYQRCKANGGAAGVDDQTFADIQAIREVQSWLDRGYTEVLDADLSGYFDTIPHKELMLCVARRISDGRVLKLVKQWLEASVEETDDKDRKTQTTRNKDEHRGSRQSYPDMQLYEKYGLLNLTKSVRRHSLWATGAS